MSNKQKAKAKYSLNMLGFAVVGAIAVATMVALFFESNLSQSVLDDVTSELNHRTFEIETYTQRQAAQYADNLKFLHATPPISGIPRAVENDGIDPRDNTSFQIWKQRLETIFVAFLENNEEVDQLRIISVEEGKEVVRVERDGLKIAALGDIDLQEKNTRGYYEESVKLSRNELYMSGISLNREYGKVEFPYKPVLRLSLPIFRDNGERYGFIIMNVNASVALAGISEFLSAPQQLYLTDGEGFFILHPEKRYHFTRDLAPEITWQSQLSIPLQEGVKHLSFREDGATSELVIASRRVVVSSSPGMQYFYVHLALPKHIISAMMNERRLAVYGFLLAMSILFAVVLLIFHRSAKKSFELAEARGESAAIVAGSSDAIVSMDIAGIVKSWNMAAERLFRLPSSTILEHHYSAFASIRPISWDKYLNAEVARTGYFQDEVIYKQASGLESCLAVTVSPIWGEQSQYSGVAVVLRDITEERNTQRAIEKINLELEEKVVNRTKELAEARDEAQQASKVKSAFISNISHEMRTPLNGIVGSLNLLKRQPLPPKAEQLASMMDVSCNNLSVLINDILDMSKIEAGKLDLNIQAFNPIHLIETLASSLAIRAHNKGLEFFVDTTELKAETVVSDPHRVSQIISNLVNNAIKFTEQGHVALTASFETNEDDKQQLYVSVTDTGIGIAKENQPKLFTAFTQADASVATRFGGTGLGLSICKQLSVLLGGDIDFSSLQGKGSTFSFRVLVDDVTSEDSQQSLALSNKMDGLRFAVFAQYLPLADNINTLIVSEGGNSVNTYTNTVTFDSVSWESIDIIVTDYNNPILSVLDEHWSSLEKQISVPHICMLQSIGKPATYFTNFTPAILTKPLLKSEFLKIVNNTSPELVENELSHSQESSATNIEKESVAGAHVLIVDDNAINIEVAKGMLDNLPVSVRTATNGEQALDVVKQCEREGQYIHCILMDCQMPIMDGYSCTKAIRDGRAGKVHQAIPIIAMTANAMLGEKEKCMAAGMSDYVTKPIMASIVEPKVIKWIQSVYSAQFAGNAVRKDTQELVLDRGEGNQGGAVHEDSSPEAVPLIAGPSKAVPSVSIAPVSIAPVSTVSVSTAPSASTPSTSTGTSTVRVQRASLSTEEQVWDKSSALSRLANNEVLYNKICEMFSESAPKKCHELTSALQDKDLPNIKLLAHTLKGMSGDIGASMVQSHFDEIERLARDEKFAEIEGVLPQAMHNIEAFLTVLKSESE
ncbi:ATP-binding protein [Alteromonas sp. 1_MG-2023]|uniref:ATP-binding protein n=1 Tax=Alteromonas sp. 1_MG-2023 TaxID=3062669 RepID=UPI0026E306BE|nr:ATP-binding protein [Alteromonas sp. 1_MG-2023]MDO6567549.1 ATP-binding protein [Alteromonas sp. 1_MG-2023]